MSAKLWGQCLVPVERGRWNGRCRDKACLICEVLSLKCKVLSRDKACLVRPECDIYYCLVSLCLVSLCLVSPSAVNILPLFLCRLEQINYFCD